MAATAVWAIVVAAGEGRRFGAQKQFAPLAGRSVLEWSLDAARSVAAGVVLVVPPDRVEDPALAGLADALAAGGATRADSVRAGLARVPDEAAFILVHDAARPLATPALFAAVLAALGEGVDGAVPGLTPADTVKRVAGDTVTETLPRAELVTVQTPQAFRAEVLRKAHASGLDATDDAALLEAIGATVKVVAGEATNTKLTVPEDLERAAALLGRVTG
ncbi:MAG TPA: 2-C-methyl-D-erythritol 4-phosphate cytidylyltransferase [Acidimicrobiales bacterium]|nr:2-C-methyl-D-erythritol 4-phosphate cytidylyltransferase [Acidimicrobiales bacterium]